MIRLGSAFAIGAALGAALVVGRLTRPDTILGVLDVTGRWDPTMMVFFAAAVTVAHFGYRLALRSPRPVLEAQRHVPARTDVDARLIAGSALFGVGWALAGICPGPALASVGAGATHGVIFSAAMIGGMALHRALEQLERRVRPAAAGATCAPPGARAS